jgi:gas vesicle protein
LHGCGLFNRPLKGSIQAQPSNRDEKATHATTQKGGWWQFGNSNSPRCDREQAKFVCDWTQLAHHFQVCTLAAGLQTELKEDSMLVKDRAVAYFATGVGFGFAAGSLIGLLYAPQAGRKTRRQIAAALEEGADYVKSKAEDTGDYIQKQASHLSKEAGELLDSGKATIEDGRTRIESAINAGAKLYRQATR